MDAKSLAKFDLYQAYDRIGHLVRTRKFLIEKCHVMDGEKGYQVVVDGLKEAYQTFFEAFEELIDQEASFIDYMTHQESEEKDDKKAYPDAPYKDRGGREYWVDTTHVGDAFAIWHSEHGGLTGSTLPMSTWRRTRVEAQHDLDKLAAEKGWVRINER